LDCLVQFRSERKTLCCGLQRNHRCPSCPAHWLYLKIQVVSSLHCPAVASRGKRTNHHWLVTCLSSTATGGICGYGHAKTIFRSLVQILTTLHAQHVLKNLALNICFGWRIIFGSAAYVGPVLISLDLSLILRVPWR
jgi:hypothetical protein